MSDFYTGRDDVTRDSVVITKNHAKKLRTLAKTYHLTKGEVIEVMLDQMNVGLLGGHFEEKRKAKAPTSRGGDRVTQRDVIGNLKGLSAEQLAIIEAKIAAMKAGT